MQIGSGAVCGKKFAVGCEDLAGLGGGFFKQFDTKTAQPGGVEFFEKGGAGLSGRVEERIPASDIGA